MVRTKESTDGDMSQQERHARKKHELVVAAVDLLIDHGPEHLSLNGLARALGYTPPALYRYFTSFSDLLVQVQVALSDRVDGWFAGLYRDAEAFFATAGVTKEIRALGHLLTVPYIIARHALEAPRQFEFITQRIFAPRPIGAGDKTVKMRLTDFPGVQRLAAVFEEAQSVGQLDGAVSPPDLVVIYWTSIRAQVAVAPALRHFSDVGSTEDRAMHSAVAILRGFGADPVALSRAREHVDVFRASWQAHQRR